MTDFIIVGRGLAATCLMHTFQKHGVNFKVIGDENLSSCSKIAAGIWNPVVFKRLTKSWLADDLVPFLNNFYSGCETKLQKKIISQRPIIKPFTEEQEKKLWLKKSKSELENYLDEKIHMDISPDLEKYTIDNGFGLVKNSGKLDVALFLEASSFFFREQIQNEIFDYKGLEIFENKVVYKATEAKNIIFCEGFLVKDNPYFNWIPLKPAKGETITINAPELHLKNSIFNRNGFLMDISEGVFKAGATYAWDDLSQEPTRDGLKELQSRIDHMITAGYSILKHEAGIRPSSVDRRPLIGVHPSHRNLFVFNGLGTKGVMLAPFFAENVVNFYLLRSPLHKEADVKRFYHLYDKKN